MNEFDPNIIQTFRFHFILLLFTDIGVQLHISLVYYRFRSMFGPEMTTELLPFGNRTTWDIRDSGEDVREENPGNPGLGVKMSRLRAFVSQDVMTRTAKCGTEKEQVLLFNSEAKCLISSGETTDTSSHLSLSARTSSASRRTCRYHCEIFN